MVLISSLVSTVIHQNIYPNNMHLLSLLRFIWQPYSLTLCLEWLLVLVLGDKNLLWICLSNTLAYKINIYSHFVFFYSQNWQHHMKMMIKLFEFVCTHSLFFVNEELFVFPALIIDMLSANYRIILFFFFCSCCFPNI